MARSVASQRVADRGGATGVRSVGHAAAPDGETVLLASDCTFEGLLTFTGSARVDGAVRGEIVATGRLTVGLGARVRARVEVDELIIAGRVEGDLYARHRIELQSTAEVVGDLTAPRIALADGCLLRGCCRSGSIDARSASSPTSQTSQTAPARQNP